MQRALNDLSQSQARLRSLMEELHSRLTPVLAPMESNTCGRPVPAYESSIGSQINENVMNADSLSDFAVSMLTRLRV